VDPAPVDNLARRDELFPREGHTATGDNPGIGNHHFLDDPRSREPRTRQEEDKGSPDIRSSLKHNQLLRVVIWTLEIGDVTQTDGDFLNWPVLHHVEDLNRLERQPRNLVVLSHVEDGFLGMGEDSPHQLDLRRLLYLVLLIDAN